MHISSTVHLNKTVLLIMVRKAQVLLCFIQMPQEGFGMTVSQHTQHQEPEREQLNGRQPTFILLFTAFPIVTWHSVHLLVSLWPLTYCMFVRVVWLSVCLSNFTLDHRITILSVVAFSVVCLIYFLIAYQYFTVFSSVQQNKLMQAWMLAMQGLLSSGATCWFGIEFSDCFL